jgi:hypothetical protein
LQITVSNPKLSKLVLVTPNHLVDSASIYVPSIPAPLLMDMRIANKTTLTPGRHSCAAKAKVESIFSDNAQGNIVAVPD